MLKYLFLALAFVAPWAESTAQEVTISPVRTPEVIQFAGHLPDYGYLVILSRRSEQRGMVDYVLFSYDSLLNERFTSTLTLPKKTLIHDVSASGDMLLLLLTNYSKDFFRFLVVDGAKGNFVAQQHQAVDKLEDMYMPMVRPADADHFYLLEPQANYANGYRVTRKNPVLDSLWSVTIAQENGPLAVEQFRSVEGEALLVHSHAPQDYQFMPNLLLIDDRTGRVLLDMPLDSSGTLCMPKAYHINERGAFRVAGQYYPGDFVDDYSSEGLFVNTLPPSLDSTYQSFMPWESLFAKVGNLEEAISPRARNKFLVHHYHYANTQHYFLLENYFVDRETKVYVPGPLVQVVLDGLFEPLAVNVLPQEERYYQLYGGLPKPSDLDQLVKQNRWTYFRHVTQDAKTAMPVYYLLEATPDRRRLFVLNTRPNRLKYELKDQRLPFDARGFAFRDQWDLLPSTSPDEVVIYHYDYSSGKVNLRRYSVRR